MSKKLFFVTTILLTLAFTALAADVTGKWVSERPGRGDGAPPIRQTFDLKADGSKLTGTVTGGGMGRRGGGGGGTPPASEISNGKIDGDKVSFEVKRETPMGEMVQKYEGTVAGDELRLKMSFDGPNGPMSIDVVAKKSST
jgi:hypothetical protein